MSWTGRSCPVSSEVSIRFHRSELAKGSISLDLRTGDPARRRRACVPKTPSPCASWSRLAAATTRTGLSEIPPAVSDAGCCSGLGHAQVAIETPTDTGSSQLLVQPLPFVIQLRQLGLENGQALLRPGILFLAQCLALDFESRLLALQLVELDGKAVDLHA